MISTVGPRNMKGVKPGSPVRAKDINDIPNQVLGSITPGSNMMKTQMGDNVLISSRGGGNAGVGIPRVAALPPIPLSGYRAVFWYGNDFGEGGSGDYQEWRTFMGQDRYYPMQKATDLSGIPLSTMEE